MNRPRCSRRSPALAVALAAALLTAACTGPNEPLNVASKELPIDLLLGRRVQAVAEAPVPPVVIPRAAFEPGGIFSTDFASGRPPDTVPDPSEPPLSDCPERDLLKPPRLLAGNRVEHPPVAAQYPYRTEGKITAAGGRLAVLAPTSTVTVDHVVTESTGWTFDVTTANAAVPPTKTTYRVLAAGVDRPPTIVVTPPNPPSTVPRPNGAAPGLYLAATEGFAPPFPGLAMARFPLELGDVFDASATDGPTTRTHRVAVERKAVFDACGTPIEVWVLTSTGNVVTTADGAAQTVEVTEFFSLGPQYGGLFLSHRSDARSAGAAKSVTLQASREPAEAT